MISLTAPIAYAASALLIGWGIATSGANYEVFLSAQSLAIVLGGTLCATFISFKAKDVFKALIYIFRPFLSSKNTDKQLNKTVSYFSEIAADVAMRRLNEIEDKAPANLKKDPVFSKGMYLLTSGYSAQHIDKVLQNLNDAIWQKRTRIASIHSKLGAYAPGFGVVGTIIGLMGMMQNMSGDMAAMGQSLAVAFVTTLYGILLAQCVFKPTAASIVELQEGDHFRGQLIKQAFVSLAEKQQQDIVENQLSVLVDTTVAKEEAA